MSKKKPARPAPESLGLPCLGVETHAHLDLDDFADDLPQVLDRAAAAGVAAIGQVFLGPAAYHANRHLFDHRPEVFFLLGLHPNDGADFRESDLPAMAQAFAADPRLKALGEIGLDYYWKKVPNDLQQRILRLQLALARDLNLPVAVHSRDAHEDCVRILLEEGFAARPVLWHCFGGGPAFAEELLSHGWHLSVPGPVTYRKNEDLAEAVRQIPLDRMVLETDCPFLSPEPWRGKRNEPAFLAFTAHRVAELKNMTPADLWSATAATAKRFFRL